jgi:hypothetical protein
MYQLFQSMAQTTPGIGEFAVAAGKRIIQKTIWGV